MAASRFGRYNQRVTPTEVPPASSHPEVWRRIAGTCEAAAVLAWLLLVLCEQYRVAWLRDSELTLDAMFLVSVAGALIARRVARRGRVVLYRAAFVIVATVLALIGAEYAARADFRHAQTSGDARDFIAHRGGRPAERANSFGFREREIPPKTPGRFRIVVVGDSFTWGPGLDEEERFSNVIGQSLGPRYEVFNFGRPGNNMPEHLGVLIHALTVSPDFVLLQLYPNDFETRQMARPRPYPLLPGRIDGKLMESSLLYDLADVQWWRLQEFLGICESYQHYMSRNLRDPDAPNAQTAFGQLKDFFVRARAAGVPAGVVFFPRLSSLGPYGKTYPFGYLHDRVRQLCADERLPCVDLLGIFSTFRDQRALWVGRIDDHPNAMANRRAAGEIQQGFAALWQF